MKKTFWIGLLTASLLTPAAYAAPADSVSKTASADGADANFRRGDGQRGEGRRGGSLGNGGWQGNQGQSQQQGIQWGRDRRDNRGGGRDWSERRNDDSRSGNSGSYQNPPQPQAQPQPQRRGGWSGQSQSTPQPRRQDPNGGSWQGQDGRNWDRGNDRSGYQGDRNRNDNRSYGFDRRGDDHRGYGDNRGYDDRRNNGRGWSRRDDDRRWDRSWHNDRRYDWRGYRQSNRHIYRPGRYYAPDRYDRYRRFSIGIYIGSPFYSSNYWIADPWYYRLPEAYGPYRWVRYYDDVLLIDIRNGYVVDVIHDFFW